MPPPKPYQEEVEDESWMTTYADAITLLMAFFVMLLSMAKIDVGKFEQASEGIQSELRGKQTQGAISLMKTEIQDIVYEAQADQAVTIESTGRGISIELSSSAFFKSGAAEFREEALPVLTKVAETLKAPRYAYYLFDVQGHTDDVPINTPRFPSNWELAAARATTVVRFLIENGTDPEKIQASGFAETRPKAINRDSAGSPIPANQALNRRVAIEVTAMSLEQKKRLQMKAAAAAKETPRASMALPGAPSDAPAPTADGNPAPAN